MGGREAVSEKSNIGTWIARGMYLVELVDRRADAPELVGRHATRFKDAIQDFAVVDFDGELANLEFPKHG